MKFLLRLCQLLLLLALLPNAQAQSYIKIARIDVKHVGPPAVSDDLIRSNIRVKPGDTFNAVLALQSSLDDDVRNLYATGLFYNIRVAQELGTDGVVLTYAVQGNPRLTEVKFHGNTQFSDAKLRKKISSKVAEPLNERKLFTDSQEIQKLYQKSGYPSTTVKALPTVVEETGRATATFEITESPKVK